MVENGYRHLSERQHEASLNGIRSTSGTLKSVGPTEVSDSGQFHVEGAVQRLRPKLMTVAVVMLSLAPILWESWNRLRRDEANRGANRRRNDHLDDSRPDTRSGVFRDHEGTEPFEKAGRVAGIEPHP